MNKKFTKKQIIEASITMDTDTFNKMKGTLNDKDKVKVVPKGTLEPERGGISEDHLQGQDVVYGRDLKIGHVLTGKTPGKEIIDLDSSVGAWLVVTVKDVVSGKKEKFKLYYHKKYYVQPLNGVQEDVETDSRAVEYGYDPELDGDKWEEFLNIVADDETNNENNGQEI